MTPNVSGPTFNTKILKSQLYIYIYNFCHFLWPSCIRRMSDSAWLLGSRVRIPQRVWIFVLHAYFVLRSYRLLLRADHAFRAILPWCVCVCGVCVCGVRVCVVCVCVECVCVVCVCVCDVCVWCVCMFVCVCVVCVGVCVYVCNLQNSILRLARSDLVCSATGYVCFLQNLWKKMHEMFAVPKFEDYLWRIQCLIH